MEETVKNLQHFSHEHPLHYAKSSPNENNICSGCKITITPFKFFYWCKICKFSLHKVCSTMPIRAMHPVDPAHNLTLFATSSLNKSKKCEACGGIISGFYYSCVKCNIYCHMLCVAMPLSVKIPSSHPHILKLELKPQYDFQCDLCDRPSYNGWLYRCRLCEFDAHISCAVTFKAPRLSHDRNSYQDELMELLSEGMKGIEVNNEEIIVRDQLQFQPLDQSILISDDSILPSYQYSDACFSIDIAKSIRIEETENGANSEHNVEELEGGKKMSFDSCKRDLKRELRVTPSTGIGSHVWMELGRESTDQTIKTENVILRRSFWSKLLMCRGKPVES